MLHPEFGEQRMLETLVRTAIPSRKDSHGAD